MALATALAVPLSRLLSTTIGMTIQQWRLVYTFPPTDVLIWLILALVIATVASCLPAHGAVHMAVWDVLPYE